MFVSLLLQNLRHAGRALRFQPAFSSVAILTLALGIGATTAVFTVVYGVLLRPLPYRDPGRLVMLLYGHQGTTSPWYSPLNYRDYATQNDAFSGTAAYTPSPPTLRLLELDGDIPPTILVGFERKTTTQKKDGLKGFDMEKRCGGTSI